MNDSRVQNTVSYPATGGFAIRRSMCDPLGGTVRRLPPASSYGLADPANTLNRIFPSRRLRVRGGRRGGFLIADPNLHLHQVTEPGKRCVIARVLAKVAGEFGIVLQESREAERDDGLVPEQLL